MPLLLFLLGLGAVALVAQDAAASSPRPSPGPAPPLPNPFAPPAWSGGQPTRVDTIGLIPGNALSNVEGGPLLSTRVGGLVIFQPITSAGTPAPVQPGTLRVTMTGSSVGLGSQLAQPFQPSPMTYDGLPAFVGSAPGTATFSATWIDGAGNRQTSQIDVAVTAT